MKTRVYYRIKDAGIVWHSDYIDLCNADDYLRKRWKTFLYATYIDEQTEICEDSWPHTIQKTVEKQQSVESDWGCGDMEGHSIWIPNQST